MDILDWTKAVLAAGIAIYAYLTYRKFRGGSIAGPYLIFAACGLIGVCSAIADGLNFDVVHDLLGIIFYCVLFVGFWDLYQKWNRLGK